LTVYYGAEIDLRDSCLLALSQSGRTPDVVDYVARGRQRGALTLAVTNDEGSPLAAAAADVVVPILAGEERACGVPLLGFQDSGAKQRKRSGPSALFLPR
jgi:glucosamine--fructose-6-phosphate aminotransferase (isomerizing)